MPDRRTQQPVSADADTCKKRENWPIISARRCIGLSLIDIHILSIRTINNQLIIPAPLSLLFIHHRLNSHNFISMHPSTARLMTKELNSFPGWEFTSSHRSSQNIGRQLCLSFHAIWVCFINQNYKLCFFFNT